VLHTTIRTDDPNKFRWGDKFQVEREGMYGKTLLKKCTGFKNTHRRNASMVGRDPCLGRDIQIFVNNLGKPQLPGKPLFEKVGGSGDLT
jgi:hypothetical protein